MIAPGRFSAEWLFPIALLGLLMAPRAMAGPVYPSHQATLQFDHTDHEHLACEKCHTALHQRIRPAPSSLPGHAICKECHQTEDAGLGQARDCEMCHLAPPSRSLRPPSSLKFSHTLHRSVPDSCATCHLTEQEDGPFGLLPSFQRCTGCHDSWARQGRCDACHPSKQNGQLLTALPFGKLLPGGGHGGEDHGVGWNKRHGTVASRSSRTCQTCHPSRDCDACHRGVMRPLALHPPDWELSHPGLARAGRMDCDRCHRNSTKCIRCHDRVGATPLSSAKPQNLTVHPPGYREHHASAARLNPKSCSSCHREAECIRCHGAFKPGGIKPHPPGFQRRCSLLRQRNQRPCLKCHPTSFLEARCPSAH